MIVAVSKNNDKCPAKHLYLIREKTISVQTRVFSARIMNKVASMVVLYLKINSFDVIVMYITNRFHPLMREKMKPELKYLSNISWKLMVIFFDRISCFTSLVVMSRRSESIKTLFESYFRYKR